MPGEYLDNYLRTFRKRSNLSQDEVAFLLGGECGTKVSRYESGKRVPLLDTALAYEAIFERPVRDLFRGRFEEVEQAVRHRVILLHERIGEDDSLEGARKRDLLERLMPGFNTH